MSRVGSPEDIAARIEVHSYVADQMAALNSYQEPGNTYSNLRDFVEDVLKPDVNSTQSEREAYDYFTELNKQNNQAKHDWERPFK